MLKLSLRRERRTEDRGAETPRLIFPREALDVAWRRRQSAHPHVAVPATTGLPTRDEVISSIHDTLDRMHRQLGALAHDVEHYRFPTRDTDPPSTAA